MKKLYDISWQVDEDTYRTDPSLSYSTLARYDREGFDKLDTLFERVESPALTFGSAVDALITGGQEEFDNNFMVADFPDIKDSIKNIVQRLFDDNKDAYNSLEDIPNSIIIPLTEEMGFQSNWKPETRAKVIREQGFEYYKLLFAAIGKKILNNETAQEVFNTVKALKESPATAWYFATDNPFDGITREYQLKYKDTVDGVDYRCMMDLAVVDHNDKIVYPCDLKTSGHSEWHFYDSFIKWTYFIQARLYWRLLRRAMDKDDYYKDFRLADYRFIVVNRKTLVPLVWEYSDTSTMGTLHYGKNNTILVRDPYKIGKELKHYLEDKPAVPDEIRLNEPNDIVEWLNQI